MHVNEGGVIIALGYCNEIGTNVMKEKWHHIMFIV